MKAWYRRQDDVLERWKSSSIKPVVDRERRERKLETLNPGWVVEGLGVAFGLYPEGWKIIEWFQAGENRSTFMLWL